MMKVYILTVTQRYEIPAECEEDARAKLHEMGAEAVLIDVRDV